MAFRQDQFHALISGRRRDAKAHVARQALRLAAVGYEWVIRVRNVLYDHRLIRTHPVNAVVLSVGNLTTGGTGKTPLVVWLCRLLAERHLGGAILTRGYKMRKGELSDEPALLAAQCSGTPVVVNPDRVAGAAEAIRRHKAQVLVLDDGFQHRRLVRDLDLVAIDATQPFGYGRVLPAGLLREPVAGLRRAHAVVLTRCDQVPEDALSGVEEEIRRLNPNLVVARSIHAPVGIKTCEGVEISLEQMRGKRLFAFCGIGNPQSFLRTVEHLGGRLTGSRIYDDHHPYDAGDLEQVRAEATGQGAEMILTTQKDWMRMASLALPPGPPPLACLAVELQIVAGARELIALIDRVLGGRMRPDS